MLSWSARMGCDEGLVGCSCPTGHFEHVELVTERQEHHPVRMGGGRGVVDQDAIASSAVAHLRYRVQR